VAVFKSVVRGQVDYDEERPALGARAVGLQVADGVAELLSPTGPGPFQRELQRNGEGIRSMVFRVGSLDKAKKYFADKGVRVIPGTAPGSIAVDPEDNRGVLFEFAE
jgi:hypothetical protein